MDADDPAYSAWLLQVPRELTGDALWRLPAYRFAVFLAAQTQEDVRSIIADPRTRPLADQLVRAVGSIAVNLAEGYSRSSGRERAHLYEYALGSAREARDWYYQCSIALPAGASQSRLACLTRVIRILTAVIPRERRTSLHPDGRRRSDP